MTAADRIRELEAERDRLLEELAAAEGSERLSERDQLGADVAEVDQALADLRGER